MLRTVLARGTRSSEQGLRRAYRRQCQRAFADASAADKTVLPASQTTRPTAGVPQTPILQTATGKAPTTAIPPSGQPKLPPTPAELGSKPPATLTDDAKRPPTTAPPPPAPKRKPRRFRNFLSSLILLSALGYAGGVYYSLLSDNFHDFFTEYVPFGEDAVAYFEEREFRKRFPSKEYHSRNYPQIRGENKVTIGRASGLSPRVAAAENAGSDLGAKGRHVSAVEDNNPRLKPDAALAQQQPATAGGREKTKAVESAKKDAPSSPAQRTGPEAKTHELLPKDNVNASEGQKSAAAQSQPVAVPPAVAVPTIDHLTAPEATEPVVQDLIKMVNNIITAVNASPEASKYSTTINSAKNDLNNIVSSISQLKDKTAQDADTKIKNAHTEFDSAAKELVRRLEAEMREQETKWREEYESEREKLSSAYQSKLSAELEAAKEVAEQRNKSALLEQEIALQKRFTDSVKAKIEEERNGRLAKLDELSSSVDELNKLTSQWNAVVDANLQTQHLHVALEAVRNAVLNTDHPTPFLNELVALKEVSKANPVVNAAIASINPAAYQRGIPTPAHIIDRFRRVAAEVRKASLLPEDAGVASHVASAVLSRFMFAKKSERGLPEGDDVEATLARTEVLLEEGDLETAAREMNGLRGWAGVLSRDWVAETRRVLEVRQAVEVISTEAILQSLLVD